MSSPMSLSYPLRLEQDACIETRLTEERDPVYTLEACIRQDGRIVVRGIGRFFHKPDINDSANRGSPITD